MIMQRVLYFITLVFITGNIVIAQTKGVTIKSANTTRVLDTLPVNTALRMALVIGNEDYDPGQLKNPVNDAIDVAAMFKRYGFEVTLVNNAGSEQMNNAITEFCRKVRARRAVAVFYFSGHGLQYNSQNFLVPSHTIIQEPAQVTQSTVGINKVLDEMSYSRNGMNIVILDACRNSPYPARLDGIPPGLTYSIGKVKNTLVFFATSANDVAEDGAGDNSPFTESLIESIIENDTLELMYIAKQVTRKVEQKTNDRQTPQVVGTLTGDFYFRQRKEVQPDLYILSAGISDYDDSNYDLRFASKGARDFEQMFRRFSGSTYDSVHSILLTDKDATFDAFQNSITNIKKRAKPGDLIFVYYNGNTAYGKDGSVYLMPSDAKFTNAERTGISQQIIISLLADLPCKTLLFMDAAASGTEAGSALANNLVQPRNNVVVLSATSENQFVFESEQFQGSVFSHAIAEGLEKAVSAEQPGSVDVESLSNYVIQRVRTLTKNHQVPKLYLPNGWQNFVVVKLRL